MDIFLTPEKPTRPVPPAECFPDPDDHRNPFSRWDGGPFLTYAHRQNILHMIPFGLRHGNHRENSTVAFTELNNPTDLDQQHKIFTTWFFFGLLAEFLGSNRQEDPDRAPDSPDWEANQRQIYEYFVSSAWPPAPPGRESESAPGSAEGAPAGIESEQKKSHAKTKRYLTAQLVPHLLVPNVTSTINSLPTAEARQRRVNYLALCLRLTAHYIANTISKSFSAPVSAAIRGLAELFSVYLVVNISVEQTFGPDIVSPPTGLSFDFKGKYLSASSPLRKQMIELGGWCKSDLGRINSMYQRLATAHYVSLIDRHVTGRRGQHEKCTETMCLTAQIDNKTYKLSHADEATGCDCGEFEVDIEAVKNVLLGSESWPILAFEEVPAEDRAKVDVRLRVKEFVKGEDEYVALSHVWADGLGNTKGNSLQKCQIARLRKLISDVENAVHVANPSQPRPKFHLWIDTLCCPVASLNPETNGISLTRMRSVYECATHVLVLDLALSAHEVGNLTAAEALLRVFSSSLWMRRLWTLQEGVLARSLLFQFKDQLVHAKSLMNMLANATDFRAQVFRFDISNEWNRLSDIKSDVNIGDRRRHRMYRWIRGSLDFRAVTYASDEPICIATLLGMDLGRIIKASGGVEDETVKAEKRMCELWRMLAEQDVGGIPERMPFIVDSPLTTEGFQWAPKSMLGSVDHSGGTAYDTIALVSNDLTDEANQEADRGGYLTPYGLAADLPALVIDVRPLAEGMELHDWDGLLGNDEEAMVYFYHEEAGTWYRMIDWHKSADAPEKAVVRDLRDYDSVLASHPLCSSLDSGKIALVKEEKKDDPYNAMRWLMVQMLDDGPVQPPPGSCVSDKPGWRARWIRKVIVARVHESEVMAIETMRKVAREVASREKDSIREFVRAKQLGSTESQVYQAARETLRQKLKDAMAYTWKEEPEFAQAVERVYGVGLEEDIWSSVPLYFPHERIARATAADHRWFVD